MFKIDHKYLGRNKKRFDKIPNLPYNYIFLWCVAFVHVPNNVKKAGSSKGKMQL
jgi:hypothetical protein